MTKMMMVVVILMIKHVLMMNITCVALLAR